MKKRIALTLAALALIVSSAYASIRVDHPTGCCTRICFEVACPGGVCQKCWTLDMAGLFCE